MSEPDAVFSAPGKALLAGGYLVLFPEFSALSIGLQSRMHAAAYTAAGATGLHIQSPQFESEWTYPSKSGTHPNPFLDACYDTVAAYFGQPLSGRIVIWSDAGFHSQANAKLSHFTGGLSKFAYHGTPITKVAKTGLGSSAALVVVVVTAMIRLVKKGADQDLRLVHNLAQVAHCTAQRKVGSGFDVATAVYGSIIYSRFPASEVPLNIEPELVQNAVDKKWEMTVTRCALPAHLQIVMGDVAQGSETPGMVRQVLRWHEEHPERSKMVFGSLNSANMALAAALRNDAASEEISNSINQVRKYLQELTQLTGVPIEPPSQREVLNAASNITGVLGGVVPGAGGEDAVCLLVDTRQTSVPNALNALRKIQGISWMHLSTAESGLRMETPQKYANH